MGLRIERVTNEVVLIGEDIALTVLRIEPPRLMLQLDHGKAQRVLTLQLDSRARLADGIVVTLKAFRFGWRVVLDIEAPGLAVGSVREAAPVVFQ